MGFWIYMLIMDLLIPLTMIVFGSWFVKHAPKEINSLFGYRTSRSMKNRDTWEFAHRYCGRIWKYSGWVMIPLTIVAMMPVLGADVGTIGIIGSVVMMVQILPMIASIIATEAALKREFHSNGIRK